MSVLVKRVGHHFLPKPIYMLEITDLQTNQIALLSVTVHYDWLNSVSQWQHHSLLGFFFSCFILFLLVISRWNIVSSLLVKTVTLSQFCCLVRGVLTGSNYANKHIPQTINLNWLASINMALGGEAELWMGVMIWVRTLTRWTTQARKHRALLWKWLKWPSLESWKIFFCPKFFQCTLSLIFTN